MDRRVVTQTWHSAWIALMINKWFGEALEKMDVRFLKK